MRSFPHRPLLKHLGSLYGSGRLSGVRDGRNYGSVTYEIDGYGDRQNRSDNGRIEGGAQMLSNAFHAGPARIDLVDGQTVDVMLDDPRGDPVAEIKVIGRFPDYGSDA